MAYGHETDKGTQTGAELAELEAGASRDLDRVPEPAAARRVGSRPRSTPPPQSARAQYRLDKAKGYR